VPCYFSISSCADENGTAYSVGINNSSFAIYKEEETAINALNAIETFLLCDNMHFRLPEDV